MADSLTIDRVADLVECGKHRQAIDLMVDHIGVDIAMITLQVALEFQRRGKAELTYELMAKLGEYRGRGVSPACHQATRLH